MGKMSKNIISLTTFVFTIVIIVGCVSKNNFASEKVQHNQKLSPESSLMESINHHTANIFTAIMSGDNELVHKEATAVAEKSKTIVAHFFPEDRQVGDWFRETGKDPENTKDVKMVKGAFEAYSNFVVDAANTIAEKARSGDIVETYKSFDSMIRNSCFPCHKTFRIEWPKWPGK